MMRLTYSGLGRLWRARRGAAAVEFALVVPVLTALVIGVIQYGGMIIADQQLHNGVAAGALYVMRGGSDATAVHDIAFSAWPNKPSDAAISVAQSCTCAGVSASCTSLCPDSSYPQDFTTVSGSGTYTGLFGTQSMNASQIVRTQ